MTRRPDHRGASRPFIAAAEVAQLLGYASASGFHRARRRLTENEGFPPPILQRAVTPMRWRREDVVEWANRPPAPVEGVPGMSPADLAVDRAIMQRMARMP
ncbi:MAG: hypothetical protein VYD87_17215 [Pseudomonadota bacterium]|nr:hypothetical protein [Pseudomonadota bacterium]